MLIDTPHKTPPPSPPIQPPKKQRYKWDEPSREAIEGAFDSLLETHYKQRKVTGFQPPGIRSRGRGQAALGAPSALDRVKALFDPTVTTRTIINEGAVFGAFALW